MLIAGAGCAGVGVASVLARAMAQEAEKVGGATGFENIYLIDKDGLISTERNMPEDLMLFAKSPSDRTGIKEGLSIEEAVRVIKPVSWAAVGLSSCVVFWNI